MVLQGLRRNGAMADPSRSMGLVNVVCRAPCDSENERYVHCMNTGMYITSHSVLELNHRLQRSKADPSVPSRTTQTRSIGPSKRKSSACFGNGMRDT